MNAAFALFFFISGVASLSIGLSELLGGRHAFACANGLALLITMGVAALEKRREQ